MNDYQNYLNMLKSHAGDVQSKEIAERLETAYLVHEGVIKFFAGVEKQFNGLMQGKNTNMSVIESFLAAFEQYSKDLAGLKFQISRIKSGVLEQSSELRELVQYCREEMTFQEVGHCLNELNNVYQGEQERLVKEELERQEELKRQEKLKRQEAERKRQNELKRQETDRKRQDAEREIERKRQECPVCCYKYIQKNGDTYNGIDPGTKFDDLPDNWECPVCGTSNFEKEWRQIIYAANKL